MTIAGLGPQTELIRDLIVTGELEQLKGVMDLEVSLWRDRTFTHLRRSSVVLVGPVVHGASIIWLLPSGSQADLFLFHDCHDEMMTLRWAMSSISVSPDMTLQQIWDQAIVKHVSLCLQFHLGLLRAIPLPQGCLRLLFAVAGFENPPLFWRWVDGLTAELDRLGFHPAGPSAAPPLDEPASPEPTHQDRSAAEPAGDSEPWMQIPDLRDRQTVELWRSGLTMPEIARKLGYSPKTVRNWIWRLRATHGTDTVPTLEQLRRLKVR
jgi:hypothetical protein